MITDAQVHLFEPDTPQRPWPHEPGRGAPLVPSFSAERMIGAMDAIGVDRAIIAPPVWAGDHNETAFEACEAFPGRFAIMGRLDPFAPGSEDKLATWLQQPHMLGLRLSTRWGTRPEPMPDLLAADELDGFFAACARHDIPLKVLTRYAVSSMERVAAANPNLRIVIDHMSTIDEPTRDASFAHLEDLLTLARCDNINVQVSTAPNHSEEMYPFADVHPILRRIYDAFGSSRMLWAADITQLTKNTYAECLRLWQEGLPFLTGADRDRILGGTAAEVLRWPEGRA